MVSVRKFYSMLCKCTVQADVLFMALAILLQVISGNLINKKHTKGPSSFVKGSRWVIEKVHPVNNSFMQNGVPKSIVHRSRYAFAAAKHMLHNHLGRRSKNLRSRDFLKKIASRIKEEEDVSVQPSLCSPPIDVAFLMDGCGRKPYHTCIQFVKDTIKSLRSSNNKTRVGVIIYSKKAKLLFGLNYFTKPSSLLLALDSIRYMPKKIGRAENIGAALRKAQKLLFSGSRPNVQQALVLITGSQANDNIISPSKLLRQNGVSIFGVGIGNEVNQSQLEAISSKPAKDYVFQGVDRLPEGFPWALRRTFCKGKADVVKDGYIQRYQGPANVIFLLDGSGDIGFKEIQFYKLFVKEVYSNIRIPPGGVKFGLLECGTKHYSQENILTRSIDNSKMLDISLNDLVPMNGNCELGKSMEMINRNIFKRLPIDAPKALIVVLAGKSLDEATSAANELSEGGARIVALGTGEQADMKQLTAIVDSPLYAFKVPLFKYLPSMSSTVVGFINEVTESKYSSKLTPSSKALRLPKEETKTGFSNEFVDQEAYDLGKDPNKDKNLLPGLRPILSELDGNDLSLDWSSFLQGKEMLQDYPPKTQAVDPSSRPPVPQNDWKMEEGEEQNATNWQDGAQLQDSVINDVANNALTNSTPNVQGEANLSPSSSTTVVPSSQGSTVNPVSQTASAAGNQGRNQGQGGTGIPGNSIVSSSSGVNLGNGVSSKGSPGNTVAGNQGSGTPVAVISMNGGGSPNSGGVNNANSGVLGSLSGQAGSAPASSGQPTGPIQVIQTQLLPIPILPVQTLPIQTLSPVPSPQEQIPPITPNQQQQQPPTNQTQISQVNENESRQKPTQSASGKSTQSPNQSVPGNGLKGKKANERPNEETPSSQTKPPNGQPTLSSTVGEVTTRTTAKQQLTVTSPSPANPTEDNNSSSASTTSKTQNANKVILPTKSTPVPQSVKPITVKPTNASIVNLNKPNEITDSGRAKAASSSAKPNGVATEKLSQKPQVVLCQIVCGSDCCPLEVKAPTTKPTVTTPNTKPTTLPPTSAKSEVSQKPTTPQEVIAAPPVPIRHPKWPVWLSQGAQPLPANPMSVPHSPPFSPVYITLPPATASPILDQERFRQAEYLMHTKKIPGSPLTMYKAVPPVTISSAVSSQKENEDPIVIGQCQDYHPDCYSFVISGMCDDQSPFKEAFNVRDFCMLSCGVCNKFIKQGEKVSLDVRDKGKDPAEIGFPEYSKKFL